MSTAVEFAEQGGQRVRIEYRLFKRYTEGPRAGTVLFMDKAGSADMIREGLPDWQAHSRKSDEWAVQRVVITEQAEPVVWPSEPRFRCHGCGATLTTSEEADDHKDRHGLVTSLLDTLGLAI